MSLLNLALSTKTVPLKLTLGTGHITSMTGNATYPAGTRLPSDAAVATAQSELQTAENEANAAEAIWKQKNAVRNAKEDAWDVVFTARGMNCESVTPGNAAALLSTGFPLRAASQPLPPLLAPQNLRVTAGDKEGEFDLMWNPVAGASLNVVQSRPQGGNAEWVQVCLVKQSKCSANGYTPGSLHEFRVYGVGKDGNGPYSDIAVFRAP